MIEPEGQEQQRADLAAALKELRRVSGLSGERLAVRTGMSQTKISRIETGRALPSVFDVQAILRALEVPKVQADELMELTRLANTEYRDFRTERRTGLLQLQREFEALERDAREIRHFLPTMLTGLLQTPEYARATDIAAQPKALAKRLARQAVLYERSKSFTFLLTEAAVRWPLLPFDAMAVQVDRLISVALLPSVRLGVTPFRTPLPVSPLNVFTIYDEVLATAETLGGMIIMRDPRDVAIHLEEFREFERFTLWGTDATDLLASLAAEFRARA
ncbi:helix-turn-helix domain-containing protein [Catenulispora sp. GAS73]|uniref:helix-turn-helix domain-containing protein n=1 Tax=Catenulispora sp. GAS73 TaxID=3156269 RepID=UPI003516E7F6